MPKYYTRACNFSYGIKSKSLVKKRKSLPLNGNDELSFDKVEIVSRTSKKVDAEVKKIVDAGYERAKKILTEKIDDLHKLAKALLTYETLTGDEIENLINKNIYPADKQNLKVEDDKGSAMGALGLKPKIVH